MQSTIIKKTVKELSNEPTSIQKFVAAFCEMDLVALEPLIADHESEANENESGGNKNKYDLLAELKIYFETLKVEGNTHFTATFGYCAEILCNCYKKDTGYKFISNKTDEYFSLILEENVNGTIDIYDCDNVLPLHIIEESQNAVDAYWDFA